MNVGYREVSLAHDTGERHPETADRLRAIRQRLAESHDVSYADPPDVDLDLLKQVHDTAYLEELQSFCESGGGSWDTDTVAVEETWDAALASAGLAVWAATEGLTGPASRDTPFALSRPPGHHAPADNAMGFCFMNNAVLGAEGALAAGAERVAIIDWDVHHGNGTQELCYDRDEIFPISIHEDGLYPGTGAIADTGQGDGLGYTLNAPMPPGSRTVDYLALIEQVVSPTLMEYDPDVLLVSAGFDAHEHDPISRMRISTEGFGALTAAVADLAADTDAGLGFILEGGYGLDCLAESVEMVNKTCGGYAPPTPDGALQTGTQAVIDGLTDQGFGSK
jgi:acetoin utilization deacetylase AcuC-like enzyme